ncbi:MAG TPA: SURF1 family protein [Aliiroseovarius sp.]|nr:SURF1 family protein [Aliiroseovarius sp.]
MKLRIFLVVVFGIGGTAILLSLGVWQMRRLEWKQAILAEIETRITAAPVAVPTAPDRAKDRFLPVTLSGRLTGEDLRVLVSRKQIGPGYRVISVIETTDGRRLLLDRGFLRIADKDKAIENPDAITVEGNLHWPDEIDGFTPDPDPKTGLWFARDTDLMAAELKTEPVFVIARVINPADPLIEPLPVSTEGIPNDHLGYAITWFLLALVWIIMTGALVWRMTRSDDD